MMKQLEVKEVKKIIKEENYEEKEEEKSWGKRNEKDTESEIKKEGHCKSDKDESKMLI